MESRLINRRDLQFLLYEVLDVEKLTRRARFADHSRDTFEAAIALAADIAVEHFASHNRKADLNEPVFDGERVTLIPEAKAALGAYCAAGLIAASHDYAAGGMQLPKTVSLALFALFLAANPATAAYPFLTWANANLIERFGTEEQKRTFVPHLLAGRFFGTMCLSETQAGSSVGDIRTVASAQQDGTYRIVGSKMWISAGDHDLADNIVHLVLARIEGAPAGVKGISLFIVPKYLVKPDGSLGRRNDVVLAGLNHKMGYRGTTNCVLNFGERGGAVGYLIGRPHMGLSCMFHMMNESRIAVGLGAAMLGYTGFLHSLDYARTRLQGRAIGECDPRSAQVPIVRHADVRRMLLAQKSYVEGALALCLYAARLVDERDTAGEQELRDEASLLLDVLTPVVKSWPSQWCLAANELAIQVCGGYGYARDYPFEQFYRDNRLNAIHEGTHGIQALDLLRRKVRMRDGTAVELLARRIQATVDMARATGDAFLGDCARALAAAVQRLRRTTGLLNEVAATGEEERSLANASLYLEDAGHVVVAWIWLKQALIAARGLPDARGAERAFYLGKLQACRYFFAWELPKCAQWADILDRLDATCLEMRDEWF